MFNFNLEPEQTTKIEVGKIFVELPVFGDLLGEEYDVIEDIDRQEMVWNEKLLNLTSRIAGEKGIDLWEMAKLLNRVEVAPLEEKISLLGKHLEEFVSLLSSRPSESNKVYRVAQVVLKRSGANQSIDDLRKLPKIFSQKLYDFCLQEQMQGNYTPYSELNSKYSILLDEVNILRDIVNNLAASGNKVSPDIKAAIKTYTDSMDLLGKSDTPTTVSE